MVTRGYRLLQGVPVEYENQRNEKDQKIVTKVKQANSRASPPF